MNTIKIIIISILSTLSIIQLSFADKPKKQFPHGCKSMGYSIKHNILVLEPTKKAHPQALYFMKNIGKNTVSLKQVSKASSMYVLTMNNTIKPGRWAALAMDSSQLNYLCMVKSKIVDCKKYLKICEYKKFKFALNNRGNYWVTTNRDMKGATRSVIRNGTLLIW